ncbi:hypothetical protein ACTJI0_12865 [Exiguobacterium sp. 22311]
MQEEILGYLTAGGRYLSLIDTPEEIVDQMEFCFNERVADGFKLMPSSLLSSLENLIDIIVLELQKKSGI